MKLLGRGFAWLIRVLWIVLLKQLNLSDDRKRQSIKISALEEIAFRNKWIDRETLLASAKNMANRLMASI